MFVEVERDASGAVWHVWLLERDPRTGPSDGWDMWVDDDADAAAEIAEYLGAEDLDVEWID